MTILNFARELYTENDEAKLVLDNVARLTKMGMQKYYSKGKVNEEEYNRLNDLSKKGMIKYAAKASNLPALFDISTKEGFKKAITQFSAFREAIFAIQTETIDSVNSTSEVEQSLLLAEVRNLAEGDSETFEVGSKSLFQVEQTGYSNNVSRLQYQFMNPTILTPRPREASVGIDLFQLNANGFDFGKQMAKIVMSFRVAMYDDVIANIYNVANVSATPFYKATFAKTTYQQLGNVVAGANGSGVMAYGTNVAFGKMSDQIASNFAFGASEEYVKSGMVTDLYGIPSMILRQAVNSNDGNYAFKVPDDRIILTTPSTDKPVKIVIEGITYVVADDGVNNSINLRTFKYKQSWKTGIITQSAYGIQQL
ncbi:MAG TPA: hypothetical protein VIM42_05650 [Clostridium sp.]